MDTSKWKDFPHLLYYIRCGLFYDDDDGGYADDGDCDDDNHDGNGDDGTNDC